MRVALVSDIHGNLVALEAVVERLEAEPVDQVVCLGDVALNGAQPRETVRRLRGLGWPVIMGNVDAEALEGPREAARDEDDWVGAVEAWGAAQLTDADRDYIRGFGATATVELGDGATLLCYHGSPRSYDEGLEATTPPEALDAALAGRAAEVFAGGHTHVPMVRRHRSSLVVNPGSVGHPYEAAGGGHARNPPWAEYAVVAWERGRLSVDLRREPYSLEALRAALRGSGAPHAERLVREWR